MSSDNESIPDLVDPISATLASTHQETGTSHTPQVVKPVPVTLITGFLGAGKTTLVNYVVTENHGYRIAVIVNEYGDSEGIERPLVKGPDDEKPFSTDWVELNNGCLCCSVKSDFVAALEGLMDKKEKFDFILIETTGLANPGPVAAALWTDVELEAGVCLDGIVTVVDAKNIKRQLTECGKGHGVNEAQQQVAYADVILLNKVDLVSEAGLASIQDTLHSINAAAIVIPTTRCHLDLGKILNIAAYDPSGYGPVAKEDQHIHHDGHKDEDCQLCDVEPALLHGGNIGTSTLLFRDSIVLKGFEHWLDDILWESTSSQGTIFRAKGVLNVTGQSKRMILQAVHELYEIVEGLQWQEDETRLTKIVLIGKDLCTEELRRSLVSCCYAESENS